MICTMGSNDEIYEKEYSRERMRGLHLTLVVAITVGGLAVFSEALLMKWEYVVLPFLLASIVISWWLYITEPVSVRFRYYFYVFSVCLMQLYHGIHETSLFDIALIAVLAILLFSQGEEMNAINAVAGMYFFLLIYHFNRAMAGEGFSKDSLIISRMMLHIGTVIITMKLSKTMIKRRITDDRNNKKILNEMKDSEKRTEDFMSNVSHELRTPINAVTGITSIMLNNENDAGKLKNLEAVGVAGHRLSDQIDDIMDYTELDSNRLLLYEENFMITSVIHDVINELRIYGGLKGLEFIVDLEPEFPNLITGDSRKIKKIIHHLLDNAIKFTERGGVYLHVYHVKRDYGINLMIDVKDTGIGIDPEEKQKISRGYYQSEAGRNRKYSGIGLGLPITYGFVHAMKGFVKLDSEKKKGTSVHISIPVKAPDTSPAVYVKDSDNLCVAVYTRLEKYDTPAVRDYYEAMIANVAEGINVMVKRAKDLPTLKKISETYAITQYIIGFEEYVEERAYFNELSESSVVAVITDDGSRVDKLAGLKPMVKPFFAMSIANFLNERNDKSLVVNEGRPTFPGLSALIVDDEEMNLVVARGIFKDYKMEVDTAVSGMDSIIKCENREYDIVFMDHMMPEMDGIEAMRRIKDVTSKKSVVPVMIALTANAVSGAREMFINAGFDGFVSKPVDRLELERVLKKVIPETRIKYIEEAGEGTEKEILSYGNGISPEKTIAMLKGDKEAYERLLSIFKEENAKRIGELRHSLETDDKAELKRLILALYSEAELIGAEEIMARSKAAYSDLEATKITGLIDALKELEGRIAV